VGGPALQSCLPRLLHMGWHQHSDSNT
jgi:hypothetical protein